MKLIQFNWFVNITRQSEQVEVLEFCNSISFTNTGDAIATVNGKLLYPGTIGTILGDSFTIGGNAGEILKERRINISFQAGANPAVEVIQKIYIL